MIKNKVIWLVIGLVLSIFLIALSCAPAEPAPAEPVGPVVEELAYVNMASTPLGTTTYTACAAMQELFSDHPRLRLVHFETPGGKFMHINGFTNPVWQENTIWVQNPSNKYMGVRGEPPFDEAYPEEDVYGVKCLAGLAIAMNGFVTLDPNIKTWKDFDGKKLGMGTTAQPAYYTRLIRMIEAALPQIEPEYLPLGTTPAIEALMNGKVDVAAAGVNLTPDGTGVALAGPLIKLTAHPKPFHFVQLDKEVMELALNPEFYGGLLHSFTVPENVVEVHPASFVVTGEPLPWVAHERLADWKAHDFVEGYLARYKELHLRHKVLSLITPELMLVGLNKNNTHPGAIQAWEEAGYTLPAEGPR